MPALDGADLTGGYVKAVELDVPNSRLIFTMVNGASQTYVRPLSLTQAERDALINVQYAAAKISEVAKGITAKRVTASALELGLGYLAAALAEHWTAWTASTVAGTAGIAADADITSSDTSTAHENGGAVYRTAAWSSRPPGDWRGGFDFTHLEADGSWTRWALGLIGTAWSLFMWDTVGATWNAVALSEDMADGDRPSSFLAHWLGASSADWGIVDPDNAADPATGQAGAKYIAKRVGNRLVMLAPGWDAAAAGTARYQVLKAVRTYENAIATAAREGDTSRWGKAKLPDDTIYFEAPLIRTGARTTTFDPLTLLPDVADQDLGTIKRVVVSHAAPAQGVAYATVTTFMAVAVGTADTPATTPTMWICIAGATPDLYNSNVTLVANNISVSTGFVIPQEYPYLLMNIGSPGGIAERGEWLRIETAEILSHSQTPTGTQTRGVEIGWPSEASGSTRTVVLGHTVPAVGETNAGKHVLVMSSFAPTEDSPTPLRIRGTT